MNSFSFALRWPSIGCLLLLSGVLAGCDGSAANEQPAQRGVNVQESATHGGAGHNDSAGDRHADSAVKHNISSSGDDQQSWPRTLQTPKGPLTLQRPPERIVSTSVTLTGTLLSIDAPVTGSGATGRNSSVADEQGFFTQWGPVAKARQVRALYVTEPNAEAIAADAPDLIVISATGGDSAIKLYSQLSAIAPTLVIDYGDKSWQALAIQLGEITGHEQNAREMIDRFEQRVQDVTRAITLPPQPVSAFVYYEDGRGVNLWTAASAQGKLLTELGFTLAMPPAEVQGGTSMGKRNDIIQLSGENMAAGLTGKTMLLFASDNDTVDKVRADPFLAHLAPVAAQRVYSMGPDTFRLDYYSASNMLNSIERHFKTH